MTFDDFCELSETDFKKELGRLQKEFNTPNYLMYVATDSLEYAMGRMATHLWVSGVGFEKAPLFHLMVALGTGHLYFFSRVKGGGRCFNDEYLFHRKKLKRKWDDTKLLIPN